MWTSVFVRETPPKKSGLPCVPPLLALGSGKTSALALSIEVSDGTRIGAAFSGILPPSGPIDCSRLNMSFSHDSLDSEALVMLGTARREGRQRAIQVAAAFEQVVPLLTETLTFHWGTGQGTRVRHVLWSLYTCSHAINLGDACSGLDSRIAEALLAAVAARLILGAEIEPVLGEILRISGEFARFDEREQSTPEHLPVIYPPPPLDSRSLRLMADSMDCVDGKS